MKPQVTIDLDEVVNMQETIDNLRHSEKYYRERYETLPGELALEQRHEKKFRRGNMFALAGIAVMTIGVSFAYGMSCERVSSQNDAREAEAKLLQREGWLQSCLVNLSTPLTPPQTTEAIDNILSP